MELVMPLFGVICTSIRGKEKINMVQKLVQIKKGSKLLSSETLTTLWAHQDLNLGPPDYESGALTN